MKNFRLYNNLFGWTSFLIAAIVYLLTIEPTTSFWDCGEFIASAFRLEVGHPPGAPFFMILGRFFTIFAGSPTNAAKMVNVLSATSSAFTILFLFWTITHFVRKIVIKEDNYTLSNVITIIGSGLVGALAYTFSDTFWFSAVEAEVYATSSLFTAVIFWAILKWENESETKYANRWIILIAYLVGISIGVHLLNLLAIPAIVFVYYFKKFKVTKKGVFYAFIISGILLGTIMYVIIPGVVKIATWFDLLFVNGFGLPYNSGVIFYAAALIFFIVWGIRYTQRKSKIIFNTIILGITVILIGYSSYAMIVIRASADPPMDQNNPDNVFDLLYYLNREQYGDRPLFYGHTFDAPMIDNKQTKPVYIKKDGKYVIADYKIEVEFDPRFTTLFPRMYSADKSHINEYKKWVNLSNKEVTVSGRSQTEKLTLPSFADNLAFFFKYQIGHMYLRYFMWNFSGRQNDIQGHGNVLKGNWISGIPFIDNARLGDQNMVPEHMKNNPARNKYYMLPLILGIIGLVFHYKKQKHDFTIVLMLFILTGLAIVVYLNQYPIQPRERDYAFAGSFYAFSIWLGLGVAGIINFLGKKLPKSVSAIFVTLITLTLVPGLMAAENWDDHDRSGRYTARDLAYNYLNSCKENAILFTNGDNDTFPLWYAQEVEGIRTDIKVCNLSYLRAAWYIDQMNRKSYEAERLPFSLTHEKYHKGNRDVLLIQDRINQAVDVKDVIDFIASDDIKTKIKSPFVANEFINYIPTKKYKLKINAEDILQKGIVSEKYKDRIVDEMEWSFGQRYLYKDGLMLLDMLATNNWERPIYWAMTVTSTKYFNLQKYFKVDGLTYQLVPVEAKGERFFNGEVDSEVMFDNIMNKFRWGGIEENDIYYDENNIRMFSNLRSSFGRLAEKLIEENKRDSALMLLDRCMELFPDHKIPYNNTLISVISAYYHAGAVEKANSLVESLLEKVNPELDYYFNLDPKYTTGTKDITNEKQLNLYILQELYKITTENNQVDIAKAIEQQFMQYMQMYRS
ncbi:protein O-mannosyl-transferase family [Bacteroidota bacterium]